MWLLLGYVTEFGAGVFTVCYVFAALALAVIDLPVFQILGRHLGVKWLYAPVER